MKTIHCNRSVKIPIAFFLLCAVWAFFSPQANAQNPTSGKGVIVKFQTLRTDATPLPVYITFGGSGELDAINLADNTPIVKDVCQDGVCTTKSYSLSDLSAGVRISTYKSGRIFISLGAPLTTSAQANGYAANFTNPSLGDFTTRWDKVEITFGTSPDGIDAGGANLSSQDFFGIPLQITTTGGLQTPANLTWRETTANVFHQLAQLSGFKVISLQDATPAVALGSNGVTVDGVTGGNVVRVLSPADVAPINDAGQTVYPGLSTYITYLKTGSKTNPNQPIKTYISGHNGQPTKGGAFQVYNLTATISNSTYTIAGQTVNPGDLVMTGTVDNADGAGPVQTTFYAALANLTDHATYGANPSATQLQGKPGDYNGIQEKVMADFFSAINFGLAGSTVDNPAKPGTAIGDSPSWTWYGNDTDGLGQPPLPIGKAFAFAQPNNIDYYNRYAAYLTGVSDTYGFAYNDRLQSPLAALDDNSTLTISVLPDVPNLQDTSAFDFTIANAASNSNGPLAPGALAVVSGPLPVSSLTVAPGAGVPLPLDLAGMSANLDRGLQAPLFSVSPIASLIQIPWELTGQVQDSLTIASDRGSSKPKTIQLSAYSPGIFTVSGQGAGQGQIYSAKNVLVNSANPAAAGDTVVIYCTGLGPVQNPPASGAPTDAALHSTTSVPQVFIGGEEAAVVYSGLSPGSVGLYQVNAQVPKNSATGDNVEVQIVIGNTISNTVSMAVQ